MRLLLLTFWACLPLWLAAENKDLSNIPEANTASLAATLRQVAASPERAPPFGCGGADVSFGRGLQSCL